MLLICHDSIWKKFLKYFYLAWPTSSAGLSKKKNWWELTATQAFVSNFNLRTGILIAGCMACGGGSRMAIT